LSLCLVISVVAALLVFYEGVCLAATLFRGYPLAACVSHNGLLLIVMGVLFSPFAFLVDCLWSRVHRGRLPWDVADSNGSAT
jgi:nucleoside permease NupC